jgi:lactoylglutathione lyase
MIAYEADHIHLHARDRMATALWYRDKLGATVVESRQSDGRARIDVRIGGLHIFIAHGPDLETSLGRELGSGSAEMHYGLDHFGLRVPDVDVAVADLRSKGVEVSFGPTTMRPGARAAFITAPDGVSIEILTRDLALDQQDPKILFAT